jgi:CPA2 family monovalent cation:H+ antiporter-2
MDNELAVLGAALLLAGLFARASRRIGLPTIPFFIVAGIISGPHTPGVVVLDDPETIHLLAMLGLVMLLFHLGIEFSVGELLDGGRRLLWAGGSYIALNFGAGLVLGWSFGWGTREMFVIAGMIGTSSTAIVTKLLLDLRRLANPERPGRSEPSSAARMSGRRSWRTSSSCSASSPSNGFAFRTTAPPSATPSPSAASGRAPA